MDCYTRQTLLETIDAILTDASDELADDDAQRIEIGAALFAHRPTDVTGIDGAALTRIAYLIADYEAEVEQEEEERYRAACAEDTRF